MLKSIDPILNADVLYALRAMGHGDDLVICDTNFPADAVARQTVLGRLLRIDNVTAGRAAREPVRTILSGPAESDRSPHAIAINGVWLWKADRFRIVDDGLEIPDFVVAQGAKMRAVG